MVDSKKGEGAEERPLDCQGVEKLHGGDSLASPELKETCLFAIARVCECESV